MYLFKLQERKESGKRGRKPGRKAATERIDMKAKLERSRQSARECRARKKLRYQYLEELVADREKAVLSLRVEIEKVGPTRQKKKNFYFRFLFNLIYFFYFISVSPICNRT